MQQTLAPALPRERRQFSRWGPSDRHLPNTPMTGSPEIRWGLARLAGSLVEISGTADSGVLSSALALVAEAQHNQVQRHRNRHWRNRPPHRPRRDRGQPSDSGPALVAWVATTRSLFFPPDAVESGISLDRLVLLRLETPGAQIRAATRIVHSGAFELVVVDLADSVQSGSDRDARQGRNSRQSRSPLSRPNTVPGVPPLSQLAGLAHKYRTAVVLLTDKPPAAPSLDPRVGKRFDASRRENGPGGNRIVITVLKDKRSGGAFPPQETCRLPRFRGEPPGIPPGFQATPARDRLTPGFWFERECREPAGMC